MNIYQLVGDFYERIKTEKIITGKSFLRRNIYAVKVGDGRPMGIAQYAIHGREFITARLALEHYARGVQKGSCWLIPLSNPDGCLLSEIGLFSVEDVEYRKYLKSLNGGNEDFSLWKANARGVDLNVNFDAKLGEGVKNVSTAGAENYIGEFSFSEKESLALKEFTLKICPDYTLSYHTKGEEIYWRFSQSTRTCPRDFALAKVISKTTGYAIAETKGSVGGYKDWCIEKLKIPSFTIEAGREEFSHPLKGVAFEDILYKNRDVLYNLSKAFFENET